MMKFIELLFEKLNGWMEPFPGDKARARQKMFAVLIALLFIAFLIALLTIVRR